VSENAALVPPIAQSARRRTWQQPKHGLIMRYVKLQAYAWWAATQTKVTVNNYCRDAFLEFAKVKVLMTADESDTQ